MWRAGFVVTMMFVGAAGAATLAQQHAAPGVAVSRTGEPRIRSSAEARPHEYRVLDHVQDGTTSASEKAQESLNRFTADGWDVMQVDWDKDLNRVMIIFRRVKALAPVEKAREQPGN